MNQYPVWRVLVGFSFCPAVGGIFFSIIFILFSGVLQNLSPEEKNPFVLLNIMLRLFLVSPVFAMLVYFFPAFIVAIFYVLMRLKRDWKGYFIVGIAAPAAALLWYRFIIDDMFFGYKITIAVSVISSLIMARIVLPAPCASQSRELRRCKE